MLHHVRKSIISISIYKYKCNLTMIYFETFIVVIVKVGKVLFCKKLGL